MSALHRLGGFCLTPRQLCVLPNPVHMYNALLLGISITCRFSAGETEAYCIRQTLFGGFRAPLEQACPLFENHAPGEGTNSQCLRSA